LAIPQNTDRSYAKRHHILVVDDDDRIRALVSRFLTAEGFVVATASDAAHARAMLSRLEFDAAVVDVMMPGEDGLSLTNAMRIEHEIPILLLTALGETESRIAGLEAGADDYLPKPFEPRELVLRLQAILRRRPVQPQTIQSISVGRWIYDPGANIIKSDSDEIALTGVEANLLRALASRAGQAVSREELAKLCELNNEGERTIDVQVTRLRRKLEDDPKLPRILQTVRGKGYLLRAEKVK
jgi:two-component system phosphate regulon response regulator OmpR